MNCTNCNNQIPSEAKFCGKCGKGIPVESVSSQSVKNVPHSTTSKIILKTFQIIAVLLLLLALCGMSSSKANISGGWLGTINDFSNIFAVIAFVAIIVNAWQYRKSGSKSKEWFGWRWVAFLIIISLVGLGTMILSSALKSAEEKVLHNPDLKAEYINNMVIATKVELTLPKKIDDSTTLINITAEKNAVRYHYLLSGTDVSNLFKDSLVSGVCQNGSARSLFDKEINVEFSYTTQGSTQSHLIQFTKSDCQ
jgi:hypothetical protein